MMSATIRMMDDYARMMERAATPAEGPTNALRKWAKHTEALPMDQMMSGRMMWGLGLLWLLTVIVLVLAIAALIKYLFSGRGTKP
jgi:hypothetical protein